MTTRTSSARNTIFDKVGGFEGVQRAVARLFAAAAELPGLSGLFPAGAADDVRWQVHLLLTDILGGPMAYDGPDPKAVAHRLGIDAARAALLLDQVVVSFAARGLDGGVTTELRARLVEYLGGRGLVGPWTPAPVVPPSAPRRGDRALLVERAAVAAASASAGDWNLFVLDPDLTVVHLNASAVSTATACDAELRRAFNLSATELIGKSILRFHPAPTRLQGLLAEPARLPHETLWSFGHTVWRARLLAVTAEDGGALGYTVAWQDESEAHRAGEVFRRLRAQAEELPVPVMFPGPTEDAWVGNSACGEALQRLAPYLPQFQAPGTGVVPIALLFPDEVRRRALFLDPEALPHKEQVRIGPETVAILVTPVRDQDQRYLGPQITWEIVHSTKSPPALLEAEAPRLEEPVRWAPVTEGAGMTTAVRELRTEARSLESATQELQTLIRLLDLAADQAEGQAHVGTPETDAQLPEALRLVEAATAALQAARDVPPSVRRREAVTRALDTIDGIARRTNRLAIDTALVAVQDDVAQAAAGLRDATRAMSQVFIEQVRGLTDRAAESTDALRHATATAARLEQLKALLDQAGEPR